MFSKKVTMEDTMFNLRFTTKQLERMAKKAEKEQKVQQYKVKKALEQKNIDVAKIYAENAIRKKNEGLNFLRMAARIDAVYNRVQTAVTMKSVSKTMEGLTKGLDKVMQSMDLEKIQVTMEKFEKQFEDLDVHSQTMESSMSAATTISTPQDQVEALIKQVAEENDLAITDQLTGLEPGQQTLKSEASASADDPLARRLAQLRDTAS